MEISYYDKENLSKLTEKSQEDIEDILPTVSEILKNVKNSNAFIWIFRHNPLLFVIIVNTMTILA